MKKIISVLGIIALLGTGCSQRADQIKATYVSPLSYSKHSCNQLKDEVIRVNKRLAVISGEQANVATKDEITMGVGLIIFAPALLFMAQGEDQKNEIGNLKGQYNTIRDVAAKKKCNFVAGMR